MAKPTPSDDWPEKPDPWQQADKAWETKWSDRPSDDDEDAGNDYRSPARPGDGARASDDGVYEGMRAASPYLGLGLQIGASMAFFVGLGALIDWKVGTSPWGILVGGALGFAGVMAFVLRLAREEGGPDA